MEAGRILGYAVAAACFLTGLALLVGIWQPVAPGPIGRVFGIVLVLMGLNRYLVTQWKSRQASRRSSSRSWER